jgi:thymidylate synthase
MNRNNIIDIRNEFYKLLTNKDFVIDKSGVKVLEIINANFVCNDAVIFGNVNHDYVTRELAWYFSQSLNINHITGKIPEIWKNISSNNDLINSNYGYLIFSNENYNQFKNCVEELNKNPDSRRAVMIYNRPSIWYEYNKDGMNDFICTFSTQHIIRNNKLKTIVNMRSNDAIYGFKNDYYWFNYIHKLLSDTLNIEPDLIEWNAGSLHIYERHFKLIEEFYNG